MGLFNNLRNTAKAIGAEYREQAAAAQHAPPLTILNPSPQDAVDHLIVAGGLARGVVVGAWHPPLENGERVARMRVNIKVCARLGAGTLSQPVELKLSTSSDVAAVLDRGLEIPIVLDRSTGLPTDIPRDQLHAEVAQRVAQRGSSDGWAFDL